VHTRAKDGQQFSLLLDLIAELLQLQIVLQNTPKPFQD
jgi:hypothetical protein